MATNEATVDELAIAEVREFEEAIFKNTVLEGNPLKF